MRIDRVVIEDFECIGRGDVDFTACKPVTMIAGKVTGGGASSNGAGKSAVISAILWALYGRPTKERAKDRVVRDGASSCSVEVTVRLDSGTIVQIGRKRLKSGGETVTVDGQQASTASGGQAMIDAAIKIPYEVFTTAFVFAGEVSAFCRLAPAQRTRLLQSMLGVHRYEAAAERAKAEAVEAERTYEAKTQNRDMLRQTLEAAGRSVRAQMADSAVSEVEAEKEYRTRLSYVWDAQARYDDSLAALEAARKIVVAVDDTYASKREAWKARVSDAEKSVQTARAAVNVATRDHAAVQASKREAERRLADATAKDHPDVCPTCRRHWPSDKRPIDTSAMTTQISVLRDSLAKKTEALKAAERSLAEADAAYVKAVEAEPRRPKPDTRIAEAEAEAARCEEQLTGAVTRAYDALRAWRTAEADSERRLGVRMSEYHRAYKRVAETATDLSSLKDDAALASYWAEAFGRNGIPAALLAEAGPSLTESAQRYAGILTEDAYRVGFVSSESGRGTDFNVVAQNAEGGSAYADLSKGEAARVDLCALFAVRDFVATRSGINPEQCFIDELFDGVDSRGMEIVGRLLRSGKIAKQCVYVSHDDTLQEFAQTVLTVEKRGGVSHVFTGPVKEKARKAAVSHKRVR